MPETPHHQKIHAKLAACAIFAACASATAQGAVLYDGSQSTSPAAQGWTSVVIAPATETVSAGAVTLDTTAGNFLQAGYSLFLPAVDSAAGFSLSWQSRLLAESHSGNPNRAGFSVILLDQAHQGIELGFWTNQVWAQAAGFTKAESVFFNTTTMADYLLTLHGGSYTLLANDTQILAGAMRDYSAFGAPYTLNNFLFFGDDTTSAQARVSIAQVSTVSTVPSPPAWLLMLGPWLIGAAKAKHPARRAS